MPKFRTTSRWCYALFVLAISLMCSKTGYAEGESNSRRPDSESELRYWLENMVRHQFSHDEMSAATGLNEEELRDALQRFKVQPDTPATREVSGKLRVVPYPGGRHPRISFLDGAIAPQRETKVSVFTPWDPNSYVVVDVPEAIWSNLGLTYLAHTHVPTIWTKAGIDLEQLEWNRHPDGNLTIKRELPNGITFGATVQPQRDSVLMGLWLKNGTDQKLTDLRVQNCVMLKGAVGFEQQDNSNKLLQSPFAACHDKSKTRWIITAWEPCHRPWGNAQCPCLHSDPKFPDCDPGQTVRVSGWLSFYEGEDIESELKRVLKLNWAGSP